MGAEEDRAAREETQRRSCYVPPGAQRNAESGGEAASYHCFGEDFESHFSVPLRLRDKSSELVEAVNDFHFAMINDHPRNEFYRECLRRAIVPGVSVVLEIGTGSGLLAMLAARLGARKVVAIEASKNMAELARRNIAANGLSHLVTVIESLSSELSADDVRAAIRGAVVAELPTPPQQGAAPAPPREEIGLPDVLVSELFGTLLLGESVLEYLRDARERLVAPECRIVPPRGTQFAAVVECERVRDLTAAADWGGFSLQHVNVLQDTASLVFTKQYGFRFSSVPSRRLAPPIAVLECDFARDAPGFVQDEREIHFAAGPEGGVAHCVMLYWEVTVGGSGEGVEAWEHGPDAAHPCAMLTMSTDPLATVDNFARDMQWGQGVQLLEDVDAASQAELSDPDARSLPPKPFVVRPNESLCFDVRLSSDSVVLQFALHHDDGDATP